MKLVFETESEMTVKSSRKSALVALKRGFALLNLMANNSEGCSFSQMRQVSSGLSPASLSRLLKVMLEDGLIRKERNGLYYMGESFVGLSRSALATSEQTYKGLVTEISKATGQSSVIYEWSGHHIELRAGSCAAGGYVYEKAGARAELTSNAFGLVVLAYMDEERAGQILINQEGLGEKELKLWQQHRREIRRKGLLVLEEQEGSWAVHIAGPIFKGKDEKLWGAIGITTTNPNWGLAGYELLEKLVRNYANKAAEI